MSTKKKTYNEVKEFIENKGFKLLSTEYVNQNSNLDIVCPKHGKIEVTFKWIQIGSGCRKCGLDIRAKSRKMDIKTITDKIKELGYLPLFNENEYENEKTKLKLLCSKHGEFYSSWGSIKKNSGCRKCGYLKAGKTNRTEIHILKEKAKELGCELISETYSHYNQRLELKCEEHGIFHKGLYQLLHLDEGCPKCAYIRAGKINAKTQGDFEEEVKSMGYKLKSSYINTSSKVIVECPKHGDFSILASSISGGHGCSKCAYHISKPQKEIANYISSVSKYIPILSDRTQIGRLEIDIWIPEIKLAIEYNGLRWHSELLVKRPDLDNIRKRNKIFEKNIDFFAIFGDEWEDVIKKDIIKSMICSRLKAMPKKIYARNTYLVDVSNKEAKLFMEMNHLDGAVLSKYAKGLRDNDGNLVMCATFRSTMKGELELSRMASLKFTSVIGGASKILSTIDSTLISYSNNRIGDGNVYKSLGFREITVCKTPSYYYTDSKKRVFRTKCRKIPNTPGTEREQALNGLFSKHFGHSKPVHRIYDYGHRKWIRD